ncbi:cytochrome b/b6 domain-containing protein [Undibacterium sp. TS12]|uniref:cytochrome b/b6 domain-containing protein n=1 Tax=Undibacterium sp. TS12 TaxID=2908202 RepID=UPI001F4C5A56|nr:cytochrome b/b6 domain-containing protein [Undibacterium sp. TS12]MCH8620449.1 cytochrome b/b6 domain-containing protein [Undibacterium sp. TS12]
MSNISTSQSDTSCTESSTKKIQVWDVPVRLTHWLIALCFTGAYLTAEVDSLRLLHISMGYTMLFLICFRLLWGFIGSKYARFSEFVRSPATVIRYLRGMISGHPAHFTGHNPAGAIAIIAMLGLGLIVTISGYANYNELGGEWLEEAHEIAANIMLAVVGVHIAGVLLASYLHRQNLVRSMISGRKLGQQQQAIHSTRHSVGIALMLVVLGFWIYQASTATSATSTEKTQSSKEGSDKDRDRD